MCCNGLFYCACVLFTCRLRCGFRNHILELGPLEPYSSTLLLCYFYANLLRDQMKVATRKAIRFNKRHSAPARPVLIHVFLNFRTKEEKLGTWHI